MFVQKIVDSIYCRLHIPPERRRDVINGLLMSGLKIQAEDLCFTEKTFRYMNKSLDVELQMTLGSPEEMLYLPSSREPSIEDATPTFCFESR